MKAPGDTSWNAAGASVGNADWPLFFPATILQLDS